VFSPLVRLLTCGQQAVHKAEGITEKAIKKEHQTAKALNDATHTHEVAVTNQKQMQQDVQVRVLVQHPASSQLIAARW